jgi:hypothetical protein
MWSAVVRGLSPPNPKTARAIGCSHSRRSRGSRSRSRHSHGSCNPERSVESLTVLGLCFRGPCRCRRPGSGESRAFFLFGSVHRGWYESRHDSPMDSRELRQAERERRALVARLWRMRALHKRTGAIYAASTGKIERVHDGLIPRRAALVHAPPRREKTARRRRAQRTTRSRDPDDPAPGRAGPPEHHLHVIAPSAFRAELRRALGGSA